MSSKAAGLPSESLPHLPWERVSNAGGEGCWEWQGARSPFGYGQIRIGGRAFYVHRLSLAQSLGRPIRSGYEALHSCDNPPCVRVSLDHVHEGTQKDNAHEMVARGRARNRAFAGSANGFAKLTEADVLEMRRLSREEGWRQTTIALRFGVTQANVSLILIGRAWKHLPYGDEIPEQL